VTRGFDELTTRGQRGRLRELALVALRAYDIEVRRCAFAAQAFNTVFRVDAADGSAYALRMSPRLRIHADGCEEAEAAWVAELHEDGLPVPLVIRARDGSATVRAETPGVPDARSCVLFEWVRGRPLRERPTADAARETGVLTARVHEHGVRYLRQPPAGVLVADRVLYLRVPYRLDELRPAYGPMLDEAVERAQQALDRLWRDPPHAPHLLHGDVQPGNVMVDRGTVRLIDFQDLIWGFEIQDVVIALRAMRWLDASVGAAEAFRAGYETVRPWPEADAATVGAVQATRHLNVLNFGLSVRGPGLDTFIANHAQPVMEWMQQTEEE
jgi:Ser/Thr protein kinase RdoA (MazF antagonist)